MAAGWNTNENGPLPPGCGVVVSTNWVTTTPVAEYSPTPPTDRVPEKYVVVPDIAVPRLNRVNAPPPGTGELRSTTRLTVPPDAE